MKNIEKLITSMITDKSYTGTAVETHTEEKIFCEFVFTNLQFNPAIIPISGSAAFVIRPRSSSLSTSASSISSTNSVLNSKFSSYTSSRSVTSDSYSVYVALAYKSSSSISLIRVADPGYLREGLTFSIKIQF